MMIRLLLIFLLCFGYVSLAQAGDQSCYSPLEAEAEQGLRIHSELMVIGLNCQHMAKRYDMDLYGQYREITARHADLIASYEESLMQFYQKIGEANPEARLNALRTGFANKISSDAASMRPDIFCGTYAPRIQKTHDMSEAQLRQWASTIYDSHPVSYPVCGG